MKQLLRQWLCFWRLPLGHPYGSKYGSPWHFCEQCGKGRRD
jgi:hypothetical protein